MYRLMKRPPYAPLFSHQFPVHMALPGSDCFLIISPACIEILRSTTNEMVHSFVLEEPSLFHSHTAFLDLLTPSVVIEGETNEGFQRISFRQKGSQWTLSSQKKALHLSNQPTILRGEERLLFPARSYEKQGARLVLASPQKTRWEQLQDRKRWPVLLEQIFLYPLLCSEEGEPKDSLLLRLRESAADKSYRENQLVRLLGTGFSGVFVPRVGEKARIQFGDDFWPFLSLDMNLSFLRSFIHSLFVREEENTLILLPDLLPSLASGQIIQWSCFNKSVEFSFDWRKGKVRRIFLRPLENCSLQLRVPGYSSYRRRILHEKGVSKESGEQVLCLEKEKIYLFDNFS